MLSNSLKAVAAHALVPLVSAQNSTLPIVNLGYELHQASSFNVRCSSMRNVLVLRY